MELLQFDVKMLMSLVLLWFIWLLVRLYNGLVVKPSRLRSMLTKQGIRGPPPTLLLGNIMEIKKARGSCNITSETPTSHNCAALLFPFFEKWRKQYGMFKKYIWNFHLHKILIYLYNTYISAGEVFVFALGNTQILYVNQPDAVREITTCTSLDLGKPTYQYKERGALLGQGILTSNGASWVHQRKVIAPELYMDKVKVLLNSYILQITPCI